MICNTHRSFYCRDPIVFNEKICLMLVGSNSRIAVLNNIVSNDNVFVCLIDCYSRIFTIFNDCEVQEIRELFFYYKTDGDKHTAIFYLTEGFPSENSLLRRVTNVTSRKCSSLWRSAIIKN
jgi:hypothetical protein